MLKSVVCLKCNISKNYNTSLISELLVAQKSNPYDRYAWLALQWDERDGGSWKWMTGEVRDSTFIYNRKMLSLTFIVRAI